MRSFQRLKMRRSSLDENVPSVVFSFSSSGFKERLTARMKAYSRDSLLVSQEA